MNKTISKKMIIKAIQTEPLKPGNWVARDEYPFNVSRRKDCEVCAVGAVLRKAGMSNDDIHYFGSELSCFGPISETEYESDEIADDGIKHLLKDGLYLHALSVKFEVQAKRNGTGKRTRDVLCRFVEKNFPEKIELNPEL